MESEMGAGCNMGHAKAPLEIFVRVIPVSLEPMKIVDLCFFKPHS